MRITIFPIIIAGIWITFSEFLRNEFLFKSYWVEQFNSLGLKFQTLSLNGLLWTIWSFALAYIIFMLLKKYSYYETLLISWLCAFVMMWIIIYNLQVMPLKLLMFAIPLSIFEVVIAEVIIKKLT